MRLIWLTVILISLLIILNESACAEDGVETIAREEILRSELTEAQITIAGLQEKLILSLVVKIRLNRELTECNLTLENKRTFDALYSYTY